MAGTATTPIVGGQPVQNVAYQITGTNTDADLAKIPGVVLIDPTTGLPYPATGGVSGAATIADGGAVTAGSIADAAVTGDNSGTMNAHLRGITKTLSAGIPLTAGTALVGKVGIDQTTPGTTNGVVVNGSPKGAKVLTTPSIASTATIALAANSARKLAIFANPAAVGGATIYLGPLGVTTSSYTFALVPGGTYLDGDSTDIWYGITSTGSQQCNTTEIS